jgi:hypothetical protein
MLQLGTEQQGISFGRKEFIRGHRRNGFYEIQKVHNGSLVGKIY